MATAELADNATRDEIQDLVDQLVADHKEEHPEKKTEEKPDAQRIAEDHDELADTTAEDDSGSKDTASDGEETGDSESQARDWFDDDLKAEIAAYGIDEDELAEFTSREEVERALRFLDRSALEAGRKAVAKDDTKTKTKEADSSRDEQGRFAKSESEEEESREGKFEVKLNKYDHDEDLIEEFTRMRDHYESRFNALETRFIESDEKAEEQHFDSLVDSLGHSDLFGKTGKENSKQLQRRQDLIFEVKAVQIGLQSQGRGVDLDKSLVNRVARMVFTEDLSKKDLKAKTRKVSKQSAKIMGGGSTKPSGSEETLDDWADRTYKELDNA